MGESSKYLSVIDYDTFLEIQENLSLFSYNSHT